LEGWKLFLARLLWFAIAAVSLVTLVVALPVRLSYMSETLLPPIFGNAAGPFGSTPESIAVYITTGEILLGFLVWFTIGAFVFWRKSDNGLVIFFSAMMVAASVFMSDYAMSLPERKPAWRTLVMAMRAFTFGSIVVFYYIFPNGRFVPRLTRRLAIIWVAYTLSWILFPHLIPPSNHIVTTPRQMILGIWFFLWLGSGAVAQLYRYRRVRDPVERLQTKLVVLGTSAAAAGTVATFSPPMFFPAVRTPGPAMVAYTTMAFSLIMICLALIPLSITLSILRYRLWDVDVIMNKALVYGTLTAVLAGLYFGSVVLLQQIVGRMAGREQSPFVTVASTLLVAALFSPLRRNIQHNIDKRFFRRKYDVTQTLEAFSATIREGEDLEELSEALLGVVSETMQPEHVSIWLRDRAGWADE
jgi:hypothetical protein